MGEKEHGDEQEGGGGLPRVLRPDEGERGEEPLVTRRTHCLSAEEFVRVDWLFRVAKFAIEKGERTYGIGGRASPPESASRKPRSGALAEGRCGDGPRPAGTSRRGTEA